jgi:aldehyde dehydrogenase (NAD+)
MLAAWKLAPALAAGNAVVLKPSEHASASTLEFMRLIDDAGLPAGICNVVTGFGAEVGDALVRHDLRFVILAAGSRRIVRVRIERMEEVTAPEAEA